MFEIVRDDLMNYVKIGSGSKSLIIISGMSMFGVESMAEAVATAYDSYTDEYTCYLFDRANHLSDNCTIEEIADDLAKTMKKAGISNADIMGNSQGGMMALSLAINHPELVHSMILCSTYCRPTPTGNITFPIWKKLSEEQKGVELYRDFFSRAYSNPNLELLKQIENTATAEQCRKFAIMSQANLDFDCFDDLNKIKCPVFVIGVEHDKVLGVEGSNEIAEILGCDKHIYKEYGHSVCDEAPDFIDRMHDFYASIWYN